MLGIVNPVGELTVLAHRYGAVIHLDGAQGIVHEGIDVQETPCDFYSFSGHKLYALTGTGVLYGRRSLLETMPPWMGGGEMVDTVTYERTTYAPVPLRFEAGTPNFIAAATLKPAIDFVTSVDVPQVRENEKRMTDYLMRELNAVDGLRIIGSGGKKRSEDYRKRRKEGPADIIYRRWGASQRHSHPSGQDGSGRPFRADVL